MRVDRIGTFRIIAPLVLLAGLAGGERAIAGPGRYDPATRTFNLTYTYAVVPSTNMTPDQLDQLGAIKNDVGSDVDARIRGYFGAVSDKLWQATNQRGRLGNLTVVDNVKQADIIVSPTGRIGRGGFANPGGFEDRQGHLVISYEDLTAPPSTEIDAQLTIFHELCHYLFALPDEYRDGEQAGLCPLQPSNGPGCLMDNYLFNSPRHGWYGRFCGDDHNPQAPLPGTIIPGSSAQQACQQLIDLFFQSHLKGDAANNPPADTSAGTGGAGAGAAGGAGIQPTPDDPFTGIFDSLVDATTSFLRSLIQDARDAGRPAPAAGSLRSQAEKFLRSQLAFGRRALTANAPTADQIRRGVDLAIRGAQATPLQPPDRFTKPIVDQLVRKARELAALELGKPGGSSLTASPLTAGAAARARATTALQRRIETQLTNFARDALGLADRNLPSDQRSLSPDERAYIKQVAKDAATRANSEDNSPLGQYIKAAYIHIRISQMIARMSVDIRDEQGQPGTDLIRNMLSDYDRQLLKYALPGKPFTGFGLRRTVLFAPMPVDPGRDHVRRQGSPSYTYALIRNLAIAQIRSLITRERILVVPDEMAPGMVVDPARQVERLDALQRSSLVRQQITFLTDQVRRNRFDNIIVIVPTGGLPEDLGNELEDLRKRMMSNPEVRLDLVSVDTGNVPQRLVDLCVRSRGSWLFVPDLDGFAAAGQRLRGEGFTGSWVIRPQLGRLDLTPTKKAGGIAASPPLDPDRAPRVVPLKFRRDRLFVYNHGPRTAAEIRDLRAKRGQARDDSAGSMLSVLEDYRAGLSTDPFAMREPDPADFRGQAGEFTGVYSDIYDANFFLPPPGMSLVDVMERNDINSLDQTYGALRRQVDANLQKLPSLEAMKRDLQAWGNRQGAGPQEEYTKTIVPTIGRLDDLGADLDDLYKALEAVDVKDPRSLRPALDLVIQARRHLGDLPRAFADPRRDESNEFTSSVDRIYRSAALRRSIEAAVLVRLKRFEENRLRYTQLAKEVDEGRRSVRELARAQRQFSAYTELIRQFTELFRNLYKYDTIQTDEDDPFAALADKLKDAPADRAAAPEKPATARATDEAASKLVDKDRLYLQLLANIYLDLFDLENELSRSPLIQAPFERIDRDARQIVQLPEQGDGQADQGGKDQPLTVQLLKETPRISRILPVELAPFTAEEKASFDLIIGFTRSMNFVKNQGDWPTLRLYSSAGAAADEVGAPFLQIDPAKTTDHMLVYRLPYPDRDAGRIAKGTYYPRLQLQQKHLPERGGQVDFTFSVASENPKVLLTASLRQVAIRADTDEENDDEVANRGILARSKSAAIIEALVTAGSPVRSVTVTGSYQKIETSGGAVASPALTFLDDGVWPDTTRDDGVYTAKITLDPQERRKQAIYQVMIEARWNDKTSFVPFEQLKVPEKPASNSPTSRSRRALAPKPPQDTPTAVEVPKFQRATSVNFLVEGAEGTS